MLFDLCKRYKASIKPFINIAAMDAFLVSDYYSAVHFPDTGMEAEAGKVVAEADFVVDKVLEADMAFAEDKAGMEGIRLGAAAGLEKRYLA